VLTTLMTKEIVTAREAFGVGAPFYVTVMGDLGRSLLHVLPLVASKILWIEETFTTGRALVRSLITTKVNLNMTARLH